MYKKYLKNIFDFVIALLSVIILSPFLLLFSIILLIENKGSGVFFIQKRPGKDEKIFNIIKFKSMTDEKDENGKLLPNEKRITSIGAFIRSTSIDELPQLFNILKGEMSFVGPRPLPIRYLEIYNKEQKKRHILKPGITGWAQVNGRNSISWTKKFELDVWYTENVSFLLDMKIFFLTVKKVLGKKDINSASEKFGAEGFNGHN